MKIAIIAGVAKNGVVGVDNQLPWHYTEDLRFFKKATTSYQNSFVLMGKNTYLSIGKPLPHRENWVISSTNFQAPGTQTALSVQQAVQKISLKMHDTTPAVWLIGGVGVWKEGFALADEIILSMIPVEIQHPKAVYFPWINPEEYDKVILQPMPNSSLMVARYLRKNGSGFVLNQDLNKLFD